MSALHKHVKHRVALGAIFMALAAFFFTFAAAVGSERYAASVIEIAAR